MTARKYPTPTVADVAALTAFAAAHGPKWRDDLSMTYWYNARLWRGPLGRDESIGSVLHGIRNDFGPTWLYDVFKLDIVWPNLRKLKAAEVRGIITILAPMEREGRIEGASAVMLGAARRERNRRASR